MDKRYKQLIITFVLVILSIALMIIAGNRIEDKQIDYKEVKVTVISAEVIRHYGKYQSDKYKVIVEYEGNRYELINVQSGEIIKYQELANLTPENQDDNMYFDNTVYWYNGKLYSNVAGIKTDGAEFVWRIVGFAGVQVFATLHLMCVVDICRKKKNK